MHEQFKQIFLLINKLRLGMRDQGVLNFRAVVTAVVPVVLGMSRIVALRSKFGR